MSRPPRPANHWVPLLAALAVFAAVAAFAFAAAVTLTLLLD